MFDLFGCIIKNHNFSRKEEKHKCGTWWWTDMGHFVCKGNHSHLWMILSKAHQAQGPQHACVRGTDTDNQSKPVTMLKRRYFLQTRWVVEGKVIDNQQRRIHPIQLCWPGWHHGNRGVSSYSQLINTIFTLFSDDRNVSWLQFCVNIVQK